MPLFDINYYAVLVAAVFSMILGAVWYSQIGYGQEWLKLTSPRPEGGTRISKGRLYLVAFLLALFMALVLAYLADVLRINTAREGLQLGTTMFFAFIATTTLTDYLFAGRSLKLYLINAGFHFVELIVMGIIIGVWR